MPLRDDLLTPIPGDNPSGVSLRYAPVYDKIKDARREDDDAPQGDWARERKTADWALVIKLASEAIAARSKDLQLAAWLTEAELHKEGFAGLRQGLELLRSLIGEFWNTLYPEIEDGDLELRASPLDWIGNYLDPAVRKTPITRSGFSYFQFKESRAVGYEDQAAESDSRREARELAISEGKISADQFDAAVDSTTVSAYESWVGELDRVLELLDELNEICNDKFGEYAPSFSKLRDAVTEVRHVTNGFLLKKRPAAEAEPEAEPEENHESAAEPDYKPENKPENNRPVSTGATAAAPARIPARRAVAGLEPVDVDEAGVRIAAVAKFLRQNDGYSPAPYLLLRGYRWGELRRWGDTPDPSNLVPPSTEVRQLIKRLALESSWAELLETGETAMAEPCGRAWLDLQRYVVRACEEYGYPGIAAAIKSELKALLRDLPLLPSWTLSDDTPTANAETQAWLKEFQETPSAAPQAQPAPVYFHQPDEDEDDSGAGGDALPDSFELAMEKLRNGRPDEALELMALEIQQAQSGRGRFQRRLQLAQLCIAMGHEAVARPVLEQLVEQIDSHKLDDWELPETLAHPLAMLFRCLEKVEDAHDQRQRLYARICRLDPMQAIACAR